MAYLDRIGIPSVRSYFRYLVVPLMVKGGTKMLPFWSHNKAANSENLFENPVKLGFNIKVKVKMNWVKDQGSRSYFIIIVSVISGSICFCQAMHPIKFYSYICPSDINYFRWIWLLRCELSPIPVHCRLTSLGCKSLCWPDINNSTCIDHQ